MSKVNADDLLSILAQAGVTDFFGVPCSWLSGLFSQLERSPERYVGASVEGEAVGMLAGAYLAGGYGCALLQNSGLGNVVNPVTSLLAPYQLPGLLIVSWRGQPGLKDAAHHQLMGEQTHRLLELMGVEAMTLEPDRFDPAQLKALIAASKAQRRPVALVVPKGTLSVEAQPQDEAPHSAVEQRIHEPWRRVSGSAMTRQEAIDALVKAWPDEAMFSTTGYTSRELAGRHDSPQHFYMQGSMGFAPAIALGWSRGVGRPAMILDGDGALIMRMGSLATLGARSAPLLHVVLDNQRYASTGGQRTSAGSVDFAQAALACHYTWAGFARGEEALCEGIHEAVELAIKRGGPALLHVPIDPGPELASARPESAPPQIATRFLAWAVEGRRHIGG